MNLKLTIALVLVVILVLVAGYFFLPQKKSIESPIYSLPTSTENGEYINKQANFSIKYPNSWGLFPQEVDEDSSYRWVRIRGKEGYIDLFWGEMETNGCTVPITQLQISKEELPVCNFVQKDNSEIWNQIIKQRNDYTFWSSAYAASPSAVTRKTILEIYSTLTFF